MVTLVVNSVRSIHPLATVDRMTMTAIRVVAAADMGDKSSLTEVDGNETRMEVVDRSSLMEVDAKKNLTVGAMEVNRNHTTTRMDSSSSKATVVATMVMSTVPTTTDMEEIATTTTTATTIEEAMDPDAETMEMSMVATEREDSKGWL